MWMFTSINNNNIRGKNSLNVHIWVSFNKNTVETTVLVHIFFSPCECSLLLTYKLLLQFLLGVRVSHSTTSSVNNNNWTIREITTIVWTSHIAQIGSINLSESWNYDEKKRGLQFVHKICDEQLCFLTIIDDLGCHKWDNETIRWWRFRRNNTNNG